MISVEVIYRRLTTGEEGRALAESEEGGLALKDYYSTEPGYRFVSATVYELCDDCGGRGVRSHRRKKFVVIKCPTCRGKNSERVLKLL